MESSSSLTTIIVAANQISRSSAYSTHHSARSRRTRAVSDSTASSGRNSASSRSPALVLGCPFLSFSSTFRSRHQSLYLSSMVGYSNPEIQICKSAKDTPGTTLRHRCVTPRHYVDSQSERYRNLNSIIYHL